MEHHVTSPTAEVRGVPDKTALRGKLESQLVFGEGFIVEEEKNGWCKGRCKHDGYAGYVEAAYLSSKPFQATHIVTAARSHVYAEASIKSPLLATLSFGSHLVILSEAKNPNSVGNIGDSSIASGSLRMTEGFSEVALSPAGKSGYIYSKHLSPLAVREKDPVATALKFLETPYCWGGRSGFGIDCSGLVQVSLARAGIAIPRDTEDQENTAGKAVNDIQRGDLVYFKGHVGIMTDAKNILHANAFHMKVCVEPLQDVEKRGGGITAVRRV